MVRFTRFLDRRRRDGNLGSDNPVGAEAGVLILAKSTASFTRLGRVLRLALARVEGVVN